MTRVSEAVRQAYRNDQAVTEDEFEGIFEAIDEDMRVPGNALSVSTEVRHIRFAPSEGITAQQTREHFFCHYAHRVPHHSPSSPTVEHALTQRFPVPANLITAATLIDTQSRSLSYYFEGNRVRESLYSCRPNPDYDPTALLLNPLFIFIEAISNVYARTSIASSVRHINTPSICEPTPFLMAHERDQPLDYATIHGIRELFQILAQDRPFWVISEGILFTPPSVFQVNETPGFAERVRNDPTMLLRWNRISEIIRTAPQIISRQNAEEAARQERERARMSLAGDLWALQQYLTPVFIGEASRRIARELRGYPETVRTLIFLIETHRGRMTPFLQNAPFIFRDYTEVEEDLPRNPSRLLVRAALYGINPQQPPLINIREARLMRLFAQNILMPGHDFVFVEEGVRFDCDSVANRYRNIYDQDFYRARPEFIYTWDEILNFLRSILPVRSPSAHSN